MAVLMRSIGLVQMLHPTRPQLRRRRRLSHQTKVVVTVNDQAEADIGTY